MFRGAVSDEAAEQFRRRASPISGGSKRFRARRVAVEAQAGRVRARENCDRPRARVSRAGRGGLWRCGSSSQQVPGVFVENRGKTAARLPRVSPPRVGPAYILSASSRRDAASSQGGVPLTPAGVGLNAGRQFGFSRKLREAEFIPAPNKKR